MALSDFLEALCNSVHPRKQQWLRLIYRLCEEQHDRGSSDFSIAEIGRLSVAVGGPSAAAIRNKMSDDYKALIKIYAEAEAVSGTAKKVTARKVRSWIRFWKGFPIQCCGPVSGLSLQNLVSACPGNGPTPFGQPDSCAAL